MWLTHARFTVGVAAVLLNERNEILLLRHRFREREGWELPGGIIDRGEQPEAALRREIREETGCDVEVLDLVAVHIGQSLHVDICFLARLMHEGLVLDHNEVLEGRFFSYVQIREFMAPEDRHYIDLALARAQSP